VTRARTAQSRFNDEIVDVGRGIQLCYEQFGDPADPPVVLIAGLGQQLHSWPSEFVSALVGRGFRVTRFDNRDAGRSTHMSYPPPNPLAILRGGSRRQYHLGDMARDTTGLLDALGYRDAHLVGISMGGMIAQTVAAQFPGRVHTLTSIMSTTGAPRIGRPAPSTWWRMLTARPPRTRDEATDRAVATPPPPVWRGNWPRFSRPETERPNCATSMSRHWSSTAIKTGWSTRPAVPPQPEPSPQRDWRPSPALATICP
jgi:pimeloyl-ACP methyl ester carboxylesterase